MYKFHRLLAKERRILSSESKLYITAVLWERIYALQMSKEQMIAIGNELNQRGERRAPAIFDDLVYSSVSSIRIHVEQLKTRKLYLNSPAVFKSFMFYGPFRTKRRSPNGDLCSAIQGSTGGLEGKETKWVGQAVRIGGHTCE